MPVVGIELDLTLATLCTAPLQMDLTTRRLDLLWIFDWPRVSSGLWRFAFLADSSASIAFRLRPLVFFAVFVFFSVQVNFKAPVLL